MPCAACMHGVLVPVTCKQLFGSGFGEGRKEASAQARCGAAGVSASWSSTAAGRFVEGARHHPREFTSSVGGCVSQKSPTTNAALPPTKFLCTGRLAISQEYGLQEPLRFRQPSGHTISNPATNPPPLATTKHPPPQPQQQPEPQPGTQTQHSPRHQPQATNTKPLPQAAAATTRARALSLGQARTARSRQAPAPQTRANRF